MTYVVQLIYAQNEYPDVVASATVAVAFSPEPIVASVEFILAYVALNLERLGRRRRSIL